MLVLSPYRRCSSSLLSIVVAAAGGGVLITPLLAFRATLDAAVLPPKTR